MSDETSTNNRDDNSKSDNLTLKINNQNASNRMVRDFISSYNCNISLRSKEFPIALKKIGSYIGKFKSTINFQRGIICYKDIDLEKIQIITIIRLKKILIKMSKAIIYKPFH